MGPNPNGPLLASVGAIRYSGFFSGSVKQWVQPLEISWNSEVPWPTYSWSTFSGAVTAYIPESFIVYGKTITPKNGYDWPGKIIKLEDVSSNKKLMIFQPVMFVYRRLTLPRHPHASPPDFPDFRSASSSEASAHLPW